MEEKIKLIASDLDGTLLKDVSCYTQRTYQAVNRALQEGVHFIVATGRIYSSAAFFGDKLGARDYVISCNGAYVRHIDTGEVLLNDLLPKSAMIQIMEFLEEEGAFYCIYEAEAIYSKEPTGLVKHYLENNRKLPLEHRINVKITSDLVGEVKRNRAILKLVVLERDIDKLRKWKTFLEKIREVEVVQSSDTNIEIMKKGVSKGRALKAVGDRYGICSNNMIAFGDHLNDISMIEFAGIGVAVGNADQYLKKAADHISALNTEDGVARAIEYFLWKEGNGYGS